MKKVILSLGLLVGIVGAASAQARFGLKAGGSLTTLTGDVEGAKNKFGFNGGLVANLPFSDALSIQPEVLYSMKGAKADEGGDSGNLNLNYIDIPVLLKYNADGLFFEAGPQLGIMTSANVKSGGLSGDVKDAFQTVDFGYAVGLGYMAESGPMVGLRYNGGITNVVKDSGDESARNSAFQLYVGYMFGGK